MTSVAQSRGEFRTPEIPIVGDQPSIQLWHGEPAVHGTNPMGWPLYRVIWSESRYYLLGGEWGDNGRIEYRWAPYYHGREEWVLEKWLAPEEYAGPEAQWAVDNLANVTCSTCSGVGVEELRGHLRRCKLCDGSGQVPCAVNGILVYTMGPYPKLGWYDHCFSFPRDREPNLECIIPLLEASREIGFARLKQGLQACHDTMRREWESNLEARFQDAQGAFHNAPSNVNPGKVTADRVSLGNEQEFRAALKKQKGEEPAITATPEDLNLPSHGFSIKQRR